MWNGANDPMEHPDPPLRARDLEPLTPQDVVSWASLDCIAINPDAVAQRLNALLELLQEQEAAIAWLTDALSD